MPILLLLLGCALHVASGLLAWAGRERVGAAPACAALAGSLCLAAAAIATLAGVVSADLQLPWAVPSGGIVIGLDALSAIFLLPVALLGALTAIYARRYWDGHPSGPRTSAGVGVLVAGMALVLSARQGMWFLLCWEVMALAAWVAMSAEHEQRAVRVAGWTYLVFTHIGGACLLVMVLLLGLRSGNLLWLPVDGAAHHLDALIVVLAIIGFGAKAGLLPFHAWLPAAHAGAPSHVSALLSGAMLNTGIYGILRITGLLPEPAAWWGLVLFLIGAASALYGITSALSQSDYKRLLAYSSIENLGIIAMAVGLALHARALGHGTIASLALAAALLHVWHHAVFKGLLFLGAGTVLHATGTRNIDALGGLLTRMPRAGALILIGAASAAGLPGLAGFASEWPLYLAAFADLRSGSWLGIVAVVSLVLCGGAALAAYATCFGGIFLGQSRGRAVEQAHDPARSMLLPLLLLAGLCLLLAMALPITLRVVAPAVATWVGPTAVELALPSARWLALAGLGVLVLVALVWWALQARLGRRAIGHGHTWDCGYAAPDARMQYTARSFAGTLAGMTPLLVRPELVVSPAVGLFPRLARLAIASGDGILERIYVPTAGWLAARCQRLRLLQQGYLSIYLLYILIATVVLLALDLAGGGS